MNNINFPLYKIGDTVKVTEHAQCHQNKIVKIKNIIKKKRTYYDAIELGIYNFLIEELDGTALEHNEYCIKSLRHCTAVCPEYLKR